MSKPWVLVVSHDAGRTGAVISLLHLLRWMRANTDVPVRMVLVGGGELTDAFRAVCPVARWELIPAGGRRLDRLDRVVRWLGLRPAANLLRRARLRARYAGRPPAVVLSNTVTNGDVLAATAAWGCPVVTYAHELEHWIAHRTEPGGFATTLRLTTHYLAASEAVRRNLIENHGVPPGRTDVVYEMLRPDDFLPAAGGGGGGESRGAVRRELGLPDDAVIVGGSGTLDWRKGPDLFVQLARSVVGRRPGAPVYFVWVGGTVPSHESHALMYDARHAGVGDRVLLIGPRPDPARYFAAFDAFALVSREDPFPLVCIEAAAAGCPVVCFDGAGGAPEFVAGGYGAVVPYLDIEAMASKVADLCDAPAARQEVGRRAAAAAVGAYGVDVVARRIAGLVGRYLK